MSSRYESLVFDVIPAGCKRALDVGCGNGELTRELRRRGVLEVYGIDPDEACIQRCNDHPEAGDIGYIAGDVLTGDLEPGSFDLVSAVASLHHLDARSGLVHLRSLVAPGGVLVVIGLARPNLPKDLPVEVVAQIVGRTRRRPGRQDGDPPASERLAATRALFHDAAPGHRTAARGEVAPSPAVAVLPRMAQRRADRVDRVVDTKAAAVICSWPPPNTFEPHIVRAERLAVVVRLSGDRSRGVCVRTEAR